MPMLHPSNITTSPYQYHPCQALREGSIWEGQLATDPKAFATNPMLGASNPLDTTNP